jgi:hypothetical protein
MTPAGRSESGEPDQVDADLADGRLACPRWGGRLRPWAHAVTRGVRQLDG